MCGSIKSIPQQSGVHRRRLRRSGAPRFRGEDGGLWLVQNFIDTPSRALHLAYAGFGVSPFHVYMAGQGPHFLISTLCSVSAEISDMLSY